MMSWNNNSGERLDIDQIFFDGFKIAWFDAISGNQIYFSLQSGFQEICQVKKSIPMGLENSINISMSLFSVKSSRVIDPNKPMDETPNLLASSSFMEDSSDFINSK